MRPIPLCKENTMITIARTSAVVISPVKAETNARFEAAKRGRIFIPSTRV